MKPCSRMIVSLSSTKKMIRAILERSRDRISQSPAPRLSTSGRPMGHPNCAAMISTPICFRSFFGSFFSQSRTGSFPASVAKKTHGSGRGIDENNVSLLIHRQTAIHRRLISRGGKWGSRFESDFSRWSRISRGRTALRGREAGPTGCDLCHRSDSVQRLTSRSSRGSLNHPHP